MSGTSLDGVDGVLLAHTEEQARVLHHAYRPFPPALAREFMVLNRSGADELHRAALAANKLAHLYAQVVQDLLQASSLSPSAIRAIGAHGQTVRHRPQEFDGTGYTVQLNNPALLAELCGIDVVADFRSRDVAAGGQGAPLVPAFHQAWFGRCGAKLAILNLGGIANLSVLGADVIGFDCGPGNALLDYWCQQHTSQPFDQAGAWAAAGRVNEDLLALLRQDAYFSKPAPKSTGRDLFNPQWLQDRLAVCAPMEPIDVQATLTELTASTCADALAGYAASCQELVVCGGGALNSYLMGRLQDLLPQLTVNSSHAHGLPPLQVEASAFAWLARKTLRRETASLQSVTGAQGARILGSIYPA